MTGCWIQSSLKGKKDTVKKTNQQGCWTCSATHLQGQHNTVLCLDQNLQRGPPENEIQKFLFDPYSTIQVSELWKFLIEKREGRKEGMEKNTWIFGLSQKPKICWCWAVSFSRASAAFRQDMFLGSYLSCSVGPGWPLSTGPSGYVADQAGLRM